MSRDLVRRSFTRRSALGLWAGVAAASIVAACGQPAAPASTAAPAPAKPTDAPKPAAPTSAPAAPAATAAPAAAKPTAAPTVAAAKPVAKVNVNGNLVIIQQRGFNPLQTTYIHNLLLKTAANNGWPLDKSYEEGFTGGGNFFEKMAAAVEAGDAPDLFFGDRDTFQLWNQKSLLPVDDMVKWAVEQYGEPAPGQKLANYIDGKWYGVPFFTSTGGYWVRKSWFDPIGFDISKQYTLDEWLEACLKISDGSKKRWGWGNTVNRGGDGQTNVYSALWQSGARVTTVDNKVAFYSDEAIAAFESLKDLYTNPKWAPALPPGVNAWTDPSNNEAYLANTIGFTSNAGTLFATAIKQKPDIAADTWLAPHPSGSVGKKESLIVAGPGNFEFLIFKGAKNPEAAKAMMQTLLSKETQKAVWDNSPGHSTPAYKWGWEEPELKKVPNNVIKVSQEIITGNKVFARFLPQTQPKLWINAFDTEVIVTDVMADVLKGTPVKDAVKAGHDRTQKIWEKFEGN